MDDCLENILFRNAELLFAFFSLSPNYVGNNDKLVLDLTRTTLFSTKLKTVQNTKVRLSVQFSNCHPRVVGADG